MATAAHLESRPMDPLATRRRGRAAARGSALALAVSLAACGADDAATSATEGTTAAESTTAEGTSAGTDTSGAGSTSTAATTDASGTMSGGETTTTGTTTTTTTTTGTDTDTDATTGVVEPGCGDGVVDPGEACDDGNDDDFDGCKSDCTAVELLDPPANEWVYLEIEHTACLDGSTAGFGINYNPGSKNVMIYLEGGGACFNDACDFTAFNIPFVPPSDGIFSRTNDANPVRDWTMIYVPYCTGDIHSGDKDTELGGQLRFFHGYRNVTRYLERLVPSFPTERVLLTGISAGGFGAAINATQVADAYGDDVELTVVDDSGPPLSKDVIPPCLQAIFRDVWGLDGTVLAECPECPADDFATGLLDHVLTEHPAVRYGLFSNTADQIIRTYMGAGWGGGQYDHCDGFPTPVPIKAYGDDLDKIRAAHLDDAATFYLTGLGHTVLRLGFYATSVKGKSVPEWLADVLDGKIIHVGP
ncbi:MAG: pectin acetylesterase-family hydrolase [Nannocystaceae bacterium]